MGNVTTTPTGARLWLGALTVAFVLGCVRGFQASSA